MLWKNILNLTNKTKPCNCNKLVLVVVFLIKALEFLQLHTPIAVKPIKNQNINLFNLLQVKNARDIVIFSLATELSKNNC